MFVCYLRCFLGKAFQSSRIRGILRLIVSVSVSVKAGFQSVEFCVRGQRAEFFRRILLRAD